MKKKKRKKITIKDWANLIPKKDWKKLAKDLNECAKIPQSKFFIDFKKAMAEWKPVRIKKL